MNRRSIRWIVTLALLLGACGSQVADGSGAPDPVTSAPPSGAPVDEDAATPIPPGARVVESPSGVPVAVVAHTPEGAVVRTPCGNQAALTTGRVIAPVRVVLDPGHGGPVDTGTVGPNGLFERDLNLTLAFATERELETRGISTALTRTGDYATPLSVRADFAQAAGAEVLVSLHHNAPASAPSATPGTEVFVQSASAASARLGGLLYDDVVAALSGFDVAWTARHDAGILRVVSPDGGDVYGMIRRPTMTAVLLEVGYLANPSEAAFFATDAYIDAASDAIAGAIESFLTTDRATTTPEQAPRTFTPRASQAGEACADPVLQ